MEAGVIGKPDPVFDDTNPASHRLPPERMDIGASESVPAADASA
jgi:hypothetical protein